MSSDDLNGTEMSVPAPRALILDKTLSKTALRLYFLIADPLMDGHSPEWDDDLFARALGVQRKTVLRALNELMARGWYTIVLSVENADGSFSETTFTSVTED